MVKKRGIAKKPVEKTADDWVSSGGTDPEITAAETASKPKKALPKYKDPSYSQIGLYLPNKLHKRMKIAAAMTELEISELAAKAIEQWLNEKGTPI